MNTFEQSRPRIELLSLTAYYIVLAAMLAASFLPAARLWGLNSWLHYSLTARVILFGLGAILPASVWLLCREKAEAAPGDPVGSGGARYALVATVATVLWLALFYLMRARMHFEGDGYLLLSLLSDGELPVKFTNYGETVIHNFVYTLMGDGEPSRALSTYQYISYFAGVVFVGAVAAAGGKLYDSVKDGILFLLGVTTGGYMLLFFGHVEHYSVFVLSVALFALTGVMIMQRGLSRWLILLPTALTVFLHILGATLLLPALYILLRQTRFSKVMCGWSNWLKWGLAGVVVALVLGLAYQLYDMSYVFRFAIVPIVEDRFTLDGYTLLSGKHLADLFNLLILLLPALPVVATMLVVRRREDLLRKPKYNFLMLMIVATVGAAFVFDPKLGMARDWDLFSFCGIPLAILSYSAIVDFGRCGRRYRRIAILAIGLGVLSLFPRACNHTDERISLARMDDHITLDPLRNRGGMNLVVKYYINDGDSVAAMAEYAKWPTRYPEWAVNRQGTGYLKTGRFQQAVGAFKQAVAINPSFSAAYSNLASAYLYLKQYDSAIEYYGIAEGMNPNSPSQLSNLGAAYYYSGEYARAEEVLLKAIYLSPGSLEPKLTLAMLYRTTGRQEKQVEILEEVALNPGAPAAVLEELTAHYIEQGQFQKAQALLDTVRSMVADSLPDTSSAIDADSL